MSNGEPKGKWEKRKKRGAGPERAESGTLTNERVAGGFGDSVIYERQRADQYSIMFAGAEKRLVKVGSSCQKGLGVKERWRHVSAPERLNRKSVFTRDPRPKTIALFGTRQRVLDGLGAQDAQAELDQSGLLDYSVGSTPVP